MLYTELTSVGALCRVYIQASARSQSRPKIKKLSNSNHPSLNTTYSIALGICPSNKTVAIKFKQLYTFS